MDVELLRKLCQCSIALDGGKRHLRLEGRCVVPAWSSWHGSLLIRRAQRARRQAETPPIVLSRFPRPALSGVTRSIEILVPPAKIPLLKWLQINQSNPL